MLNFLSSKWNFSRISKLKEKVLRKWRLITSVSDKWLQDTFSKIRVIVQKEKKKEAQEDLLDKYLDIVFAIVCETIRRKIGLTLYPTQILGGIALHQGKIAQMNTGEGKTLAAFLPTCLNALRNRIIFLVTVNEYLAKRDCELAKTVLNFLGISVGFNSNTLSFEEKLKLYRQCKVIYTTSNELGFDYLKNNLVTDPDEEIQTDHFYAIIDEVDSILLDEARNPHIITESSRAFQEGQVFFYHQATKLANLLKKEEDYKVDKKYQAIWLTTKGTKKCEKFYNVDNLFLFSNHQLNNLIHNALKVKHFYLDNIHYIVRNDRIILINFLTGRLVPNQVYGAGIQQAIESKEHVTIRQQNRSIAIITYQNFFRLFEKLSGMTGTAESDREEFLEIYGLEIVIIPPFKKLIRRDEHDLIFPDKKSKNQAVIKTIKRISETTKQPILIGSSSVEVSEQLSRLLWRENIFHNTLNAVKHEQEAEIISHGGQLNSIIISTNMAGRGTDIILSQESKKAGGLFVIGVEDDFTQRTRLQLIGRAGRQGDPGKSRFFVSLEDNIIKQFGVEDSIKKTLKSIGGNWPISGKTWDFFISDMQEISRNHQTYQRQDSLTYDVLINKQRKFLYNFRRKVLLSKNSRDIFLTKRKFLEDNFLWLFFKNKTLKKIDLFWSKYLVWLEEARKLVTPLSYYAQKNPQEVFFLETLKAFKNGFQQLEKEIFTLLREYLSFSIKRQKTQEKTNQ